MSFLSNWTKLEKGRVESFWSAHLEHVQSFFFSSMEQFQTFFVNKMDRLKAESNTKNIIVVVVAGAAAATTTTCCGVWMYRRSRRNRIENDTTSGNNSTDKSIAGSSSSASKQPPHHSSSPSVSWWMYEIAELSDTDCDDDDEEHQHHHHHHPRSNGGSNSNNSNTNKRYDPSRECVYLDYNGTTPVYPEVLQAMLPYLSKHFGNPSSSHVFGRRPREAVDKARRQILRELLCVNNNNYKSSTTTTETTTTTHQSSSPSSSPSFDDESSIWFTGCGTESDNLAIHLALEATSVSRENDNNDSSNNKRLLPHIVTSNIEHPAITACLEALEQKGQIEVTYVPVSKFGRVTVEDMVEAIRPNQTILVTLMLANNETGILQPVADVSKYCRQHGILFHTDAAQAAGKVSVALDDMGYPDMVTLVGHKLGAPKGIACLYVRRGCLEEHGRSISQGGRRKQPGILLLGGGQEFGRRGGTENVASIVAMGKAAVLSGRKKLPDHAMTMEVLRARLLCKLIEYLGTTNVRDNNGLSDPSLRLPNTLSVGLWGVNSGELLASIGDKVAASAGATCHSAGAVSSVSSVLRAMQIPEEFARGTLRLSVGPRTTVDDVDRAAEIIARYAKIQLATKYSVGR